MNPNCSGKKSRCISLLFLLFHFFVSPCFTQDITTQEKKVILIFKFADYVEWADHEQLDTFKIGVFSDDGALLKSLRIFETIHIKNKPISLTRFYSVSEIKDIQMLVLSDDKNYLIENIVQQIANREILLITDRSRMQDQIMINFIYSNDKKLDFEVNKANIIKEGLVVKPELLLLGGTEVDLAALYKESQRNMADIQKQVQELEIKYKQQQEELNRRDKLLEEKNREILDKNIDISRQNQAIEDQKTELGTLNIKVKEQDEKLEQDLALLGDLQRQLENRSQEIDSSKKILSELNEEIVKKQKRIDTQETAISGYESTVGQQKTIIYLAISSLAMLLVTVIFVYRGFINKKKTAKQLAEKEAEIRMLFNMAPVPVVMTELVSGKAIYINQLGLDLLKLRSGKSLKHISLKDFYVNPAQREKMIETVKKENRINNQEVLLKNSHGEEFYGSLSGLITQYETKTVLFLAVKDITDIKLAVNELNKYKNHLEDLVKERSQKLVESQNRFKDMAELLPETIFEMDMNGMITFVNKRGLEMFGISNEDLSSEWSIYDVLAGDEHEEARSIFQNLRNGKSLLTNEFQFYRKDDSSFPGILYMNSTQTNNKEHVVRGIVVDITERKNLEREILNTMIQTEEKERKRFAEDLHDGLGSLLSSLNLYVDMIDNPELSEDEREKLFSTMRKIIDESIKSSKEISNNLRPSTLSRFGLTGSLQSFCDKINDTGKIKITFDYTTLNIKLNPSIENALYRIVNELINNTIKYASASKIAIQLAQANDLLSLHYMDDGSGFDKQKALDSEGMGLKNIITRVKSINGTCDITSKMGEGTEVSIRVKVAN